MRTLFLTYINRLKVERESESRKVIIKILSDGIESDSCNKFESREATFYIILHPNRKYDL